MPAFVASQLSIEDKLHGTPMQPVLFAKAVYVLPSDCIASGRDKGKLAFDACKATPSFGEHILHVVGMGSNKQMVRAYANGIVAFVANVQGVIKCSIGEFIREAVRIFSGATSVLVNKKTPVFAFRLCFAVPYPAISRLFDFAPKSFFNGEGTAHGGNDTPPIAINQVNSWGGYAYSHA